MVYAVAREGRCGPAPDRLGTNLSHLFEVILDRIPPPFGDPDGSLQVLITNVIPDLYRGPLAVGRVMQGSLHNRRPVSLCHRDGSSEQATVSGLFVYAGLDRVEVEQAGPGEIVALAGMPQILTRLVDGKIHEPFEEALIDVDEAFMGWWYRNSTIAGES